MSSQSVLALLGGGLAGAMLTAIVQWLIRRWNRPILKVDFDVGVAGCDVSTPTSAAGVRQHFLRLKVRNCGLTYAAKVGACLTQISHGPLGGAQTTFENEVLDFKLAIGNGATLVNIASKGHRYFDVAHTVQTTSVAHILDVAALPLALTAMGFGTGTYKATVFVSAENARSVTKQIAWRWDGTLNGIAIADP